MTRSDWSTLLPGFLAKNQNQLWSLWRCSSSHGCTVRLLSLTKYSESLWYMHMKRSKLKLVREICWIIEDLVVSYISQVEIAVSPLVYNWDCPENIKGSYWCLSRLYQYRNYAQPMKTNAYLPFTRKERNRIQQTIGPYHLIAWLEKYLFWAHCAQPCCETPVAIWSAHWLPTWL